VLHPEVGKWVALGGNAYHLGEACRRLAALGETAAIGGARSGTRAMAALTTDAGPAPRLLQGFADLLPDPAKLAKLRPELTSDGGARGARPSGTPAPSRRGARTRKSQARRRRRG
jgi:hypothetical protein